MHRYFFDVCSGVKLIDYEGSMLDGPGAALIETHAIARELLAADLTKTSTADIGQSRLRTKSES